MLVCHLCKKLDKPVYTISGDTWCRECHAHYVMYEALLHGFGNACTMRETMHRFIQDKCEYCAADVAMQVKRNLFKRLWHGRANAAQYVDKHCRYSCSVHLTEEFDFKAEEELLRTVAANAPWIKQE